MYLAFYDGDRHRPVKEKVQEAVERYVDRHDAIPTTILCSHAQYAATVEFAGGNYAVEAKDFIQVHSFYVGVPDDGPDTAPNVPTATKPDAEG